MEFFRKSTIDFFKINEVDPNIEKTLKHLSKVALYDLKGIDALQPEVKDKCVALINRMKLMGRPVYISEGFRTALKQDTYFSQGRTSPGSIVTNARGLQSYHQYGLAFDLVFVTYNWNPPSDIWWDVLGAEGQKLGLEWGGAWEGFKDKPHFEYHPGYSWKLLEDYFKK